MSRTVLIQFQQHFHLLGAVSCLVSEDVRIITVWGGWVFSSKVLLVVLVIKYSSAATRHFHPFPWNPTLWTVHVFCIYITSPLEFKHVDICILLLFAFRVILFLIVVSFVSAKVEKCSLLNFFVQTMVFQWLFFSFTFFIFISTTLHDYNWVSEIKVKKKNI